jgi:hypothetical protein
MQLKVCLA